MSNAATTAATRAIAQDARRPQIPSSYRDGRGPELGGDLVMGVSVHDVGVNDRPLRWTQSIEEMQVLGGADDAGRVESGIDQRWGAASPIPSRSSFDI